jgi:hypothetical protein
MRTVFKYPFPIRDEIEVSMPEGAHIVAVQLQDNQPTMWAEVDTTKTPWPRKFRIFGTGHPISDGLRWIATFQMGSLVWHVYE